jgi:hypothetical protein
MYVYTTLQYIVEHSTYFEYSCMFVFNIERYARNSNKKWHYIVYAVYSFILLIVICKVQYNAVLYFILVIIPYIIVSKELPPKFQIFFLSVLHFMFKKNGIYF